MVFIGRQTVPIDIELVSHKTKVLFCIARALIDAWYGNIDKGLFMTGYDLDRVNEIIPIKRFFEELEELSQKEEIETAA